MKTVVTHGSLGRSYFNRRSVNELVFTSAQVTAALVLGGMLFWLAIAIPIGILSALRPRSLLDRGGMIFVLIGISCHPIWIGSILLYVFSFRLGWLPNGGYCDMFQTGGGCFGPRQWAMHLILPWIAYGLLFAALYTRMIRSFTIEALREDHVMTARAKGGSECHVIRHHVLRQVALPVVTMLGMDLGIFLASAVFVETVFGLPGIGTLLVNATIRLDLPVLVGITVFVTVIGAAVQPPRRPRLRAARSAGARVPAASAPTSSAPPPPADRLREPVGPGALVVPARVRADHRRAGLAAVEQDRGRDREHAVAGPRSRSSRRCRASRTRRRSCSAASCSRTGSTARHGPHHGAQKSTTTGPSPWSTSCSKLASVTSRTTRDATDGRRGRGSGAAGTFQIASSTIVLAHLRAADLAVDERDRHLDDAEARAERRGRSSRSGRRSPCESIASRGIASSTARR